MDNTATTPPYDPDEKKTDRLNVMVQPGRKDWWMRAAESEGVDFSNWVRSALDSAAMGISLPQKSVDQAILAFMAAAKALENIDLEPDAKIVTLRELREAIFGTAPES